jgi:hypothetical protein
MSGHLVSDGTHLISTSDAEDCDCCGSPPITCDFCPDATSPQHAKVVLAGFAGPDGLGHCANCATLNGTYVLAATTVPFRQFVSAGAGACYWGYSDGTLDPCDNAGLAYPGLTLVVYISAAGVATLFLEYAHFQSVFPAADIYAGDDQGSGSLATFIFTGDCSTVANQASDAAYTEGNGFSGGVVCGAAATVTLSFLP